MINYIICEDEKVLISKYIHIIEKFMINYDINYKINTFSEYNDNFYKCAGLDTFKIFILDIKTPNGSGIDAARIIREEYDDWTSMIIIISAYSEYKYEALSERLLLVDFINKLNQCEKNLEEALLICLKNYDHKANSLKYTYKNTNYNIEFKNILYIEKEQNSKRSIIVTKDNKFLINSSINELVPKLDKRFIKCNRGIIVNSDQIKKYVPKDNLIVFKNDLELQAVSRSNKKEIENRVRGIY